MSPNHSGMFKPMKGKKMCEDFPCCGHEMGDCNGQKYGSDESIMKRYLRRMDFEDDFGFSPEDDY